MSSDSSAGSSPLIDVDDSILLVIDLQERFLDKLAPERRRPLLERAAWLMELAKLVGVPIVTTAEDTENMGGMVDELVRRLPEGTEVLNKMVFGLARDDDVLASVEATGRQSAILVGLETDVCITHSALGLLGAGYRVAVVTDAVDSPADAHAQGLARLRGTGVIFTSTKGLYYEWARTVARAESLRRSLDEVAPLPTGILL